MTKEKLAEVQAIRDGMTKGEWKMIIHAAGNISSNSRAVVSCMVHNSNVIDVTDENIHNANAIILAINYTFGAGINPVVMPDAIELLEECRQQIEYLHKKFGKTGTGENVLSKIETLLSQAKLKP